MTAQPGATPLALWLMSTGASFFADLRRYGLPVDLVDALLVDLESTGKPSRQEHAAETLGHGTTIAASTPDEIRVARSLQIAPTFCRLNALSVDTVREANEALAAGAESLLLPMVQRARDVERLLEIVNGRASVGIMLETVAGLEQSREFARLPVDYVFFGLVDLAIERRSRSVFSPLIDGTLTAAVTDLGSVPFGLLAASHPGTGDPIPNRLLLGELLRVGAAFTVIRSSFWRELGARAPTEAIREIRAQIVDLSQRDAGSIEADREQLWEHVARLELVRS